MRIEIRSDSVLIDGYVNAVGRDSRPVVTPRGKVVEQIEPRAFQRALDRAANVDLLLNHDDARKLGSTKDGNLELFEDNIGLRAIALVKDPEVIQKARNKELRGWSFKQYVTKDSIEERAEGQIPRRHVHEMDITEVSLIDKRMNPVYVGTSVEMRAEQEVIAETRGDEFRAVTVEEKPPENKPDYSEYEKRIENLKSR